MNRIAISVERKEILFNNYVELKSVYFKYPESENLALDGIDLKIKRGDYVAFVGKSGSGKTTAVDMLLGLLEPQMGKLIVDGHEINGENRKIWQSSIGYVPQEVFLKDSTIAENIAYGVKNLQKKLMNSHCIMLLKLQTYMILLLKNLMKDMTLM